MIEKLFSFNLTSTMSTLVIENSYVITHLRDELLSLTNKKC